MIQKIIRILLAIEFLVALPAVFSLWSQAGGQYHLDLMFWPWKFGLGLAAAVLFTMITSEFLRSNGRWTRRGILLASMLVTILIAAGLVTYYYHLNEPPADEGDDGQTQLTRTHAGNHAGTHARRCVSKNYS